MVVSIRYFSILILEFLKQEKITDEKHINRQLNLTSFHKKIPMIPKKTKQQKRMKDTHKKLS